MSRIKFSSNDLKKAKEIAGQFWYAQSTIAGVYRIPEFSPSAVMGFAPVELPIFFVLNTHAAADGFDVYETIDNNFQMIFSVSASGRIVDHSLPDALMEEVEC